MSTLSNRDDDGEPRKRSRTRATRTAGQRKRSHLLDVASALFKAQGLNGVTITAIADAADAFPSQITYYFHTKEALFVEAACRDMLHIAESAELAAARARTPATYMKALVDSVLQADGLAFFVEALVLARQRTDLAAQVARTIERLHVDGARAFAGEVARRGWRPLAAPELMSRKFWAIALGVALEGQALGKAGAEMAADMVELLGAMAETSS
ncbi:TetR/AcrR family transcriptional regulator C-terminal domain-containing protein [Rhodoligotrophos defluvii]|uniref:TetR/AcrR family transcriptional regulator C-terminal domain-containing protein n=1 Tax=Rhodoligotrophos defluvii TaxID=2561934 RepID=UPI0010C9E8E5|nr:TetR/AcrR family transcriptional regulator C-terminal domain-containing protein [Rhodoligotrophos defluvii]